MKKSRLNIIFISVCMLALLAPLVGMSFAKTTATTEKRSLAEPPEIIVDGKLNIGFLGDAGKYFEDHFAFKNQFVAADSTVQSSAFKTSCVDTVVVGKNGWLYYTDSVDDYLARHTLNDRQAFDVSYNLSIIQKKMLQQDIDFYFTVAPDKSSLYGENMPYYLSIKVGNENNYSKISKGLDALGINYIDLFSAFENQDEVLYLKQDSHWNENGAVLAYNTICDAIDIAHNDYSETPQLRTKSKIGDLSSALYSVAAKSEWDSTYQYPSQYKIINEAENFEAELVETKNNNAQKSLLMFRDSFGNTLSPYIAEDYKSACFSKNTVYLLDSYIEKCKPDTVLVEIVERNLDRFVMFSPDAQQASGAPVMAAPVSDIDISGAKIIKTDTEINTQDSQLQPDYKMIYGIFDFKPENNSCAYAIINGIAYDAFLTSNENNEEGYMLYMPNLDDNAEIQIAVNTNGNIQIIAQKQIR